MDDLTTEELYTIILSIGVRGIKLEGRDRQFLLDILYNSQYCVPTETKQRECSICYERVSTSLNCTHTVCGECLSKLTDDRCPECRKELQGELVTPTILAGIYERKLHRKEEQEMEDLLSVLASF